MTEQTPNQERRAMIKTVAGLVVGVPVTDSLQAGSADGGVTPMVRGDFGFLAGQWVIRHRRLKTGDTDEWDVFGGEATVWPALEGKASIEELRIPERGFSGMGIRLFHADSGTWADHWVNAKNGVLGPPMMGRFENGAGTFLVDEMDNGRPVKTRGIWDQITPISCRWCQSSSHDGGMSWKDNWLMDWTRA